MLGHEISFEEHMLLLGVREEQEFERMSKGAKSLFGKLENCHSWSKDLTPTTVDLRGEVRICSTGANTIRHKYMNTQN